jgi:hypothetical protein
MCVAFSVGAGLQRQLLVWGRYQWQRQGGGSKAAGNDSACSDEAVVKAAA